MPRLHALEPRTGATPMRSKALVFPHGPSDQHAIQMTGNLLEFRRTEPTVVADPAPDRRRYLIRQRRERRVAFQMQTPASNRLPDRRQRAPADRRRECREQTPVSIACGPRTERVAEKVERLVFRSPRSPDVLAVHHPGLLRVQFQPYLAKPCVQMLAHLVGNRSFQAVC